MNSFLSKLKRKGSTDGGSLGSNSSLFNSATLNITPYSVNEKHLSPFLKAIWKNDVNKVKKLMKKNYNQVDQDKRSGLHLASATGNLEIIKELLSNYSNEILEKQDINKKTALFKAVEKGIYENVQYLLEKGAKTDVKDEKGDSLVHAAIRYKHENILQYLLQKEVNFNERNREGLIPLHVAADLNFVDGIKILLKYMSDIDVKTQSGKTALMIAAESGYENTLKLLLSHNSDQSICDENGYNALYYATFHQRAECIKLLERSEESKSQQSTPKKSFVLQTPDFLANKNADESDRSRSRNSQEEPKPPTPKRQPKLRESKVREANSGESVASNSVWMGDYSNSSSDDTIPVSKHYIAIHDISTPSSMPNPSDIVINKSIINNYNSELKNQITDDEESQWSDNEKSHHEISHHKVVEIKTNKPEKLDTKIEDDSHKDSEWDSDDTEHQDVQIDLSTIEEESAGKKEQNHFLRSPKSIHEKTSIEQDTSDLSYLAKPHINDDGQHTDSNIEEIFNKNFIITNPPIKYDCTDNSIDEDNDCESDILEELCTTQKPNIPKTPTPSSKQFAKPPISPSMNNELNKPIPTITIEEFTPKKRTRKLHQAGGDNLSYSSSEFDMNSRNGSLADSDSLNDLKKFNVKSADDYIRKCAHLESKLRSLESEKDGLTMKLNAIKELKDKSDNERLKLQNQNQKFETKLSEKKDELTDFKSRLAGVEEQLKKREKELFEIKKAKQEIEDKHNQLELNNITSNSKIKQLQQEMENLQSDYQRSNSNQEDSKKQNQNYEQELENWTKTNNKLNLEISNLLKDIKNKDAAYSKLMDDKNGIIQNLEKDIKDLNQTVSKENDDKESLQEEIDQLRKTIKNLNSDLESSNKSISLVTKQEKENNGLKDRIKEVETKLLEIMLDNENLTKTVADRDKKNHNFEMEIDRLENQVNLKDERLSYLEIQIKTYENQAKDLEKLLERKNTELHEFENKFMDTESELKKENKKNANVLETVNEAINTAINDCPESSEILEKLQNIRQSINCNSSVNITSPIYHNSLNNSSDLSIELSKSRSQIRVLQDQIEQMKNQSNGNKEYESRNFHLMKYQTTSSELDNNAEVERIDKLEKVEKMNYNELQSKSRTIQSNHKEMEISKLSTNATMIEEERDSLSQQIKALNDMLAKERQLKDSLTEQLVNIMKSSNGSIQQINEQMYPNSISQFSIPFNFLEHDKRPYANSMLNLSFPKSIGVEDEELRQKLRQELDRSILRHLENGKPIQQLNVKDKIRSLHIGRQSTSTVAWKSP